MNEAPSAQAPAQQRDFGPRFDPMPKSETYIFTVVAYDFLPKFEQKDPTTGETKIFDALQFYFGTIVDGKAYFLKPWPSKYSIHEKAGYTKLYRAIKGAAPLPGSNPKELLGGGITIEVNNEAKVSKKGTPYTASRAKSYAAVHPKLKGEIVPLNALEPAFKAALEASKKTEDAPF